MREINVLECVMYILHNEMHREHASRKIQPWIHSTKNIIWLWLQQIRKIFEYSCVKQWFERISGLQNKGSFDLGVCIQLRRFLTLSLTVFKRRSWLCYFCCWDNFQFFICNVFYFISFNVYYLYVRQECIDAIDWTGTLLPLLT